MPAEPITNQKQADAHDAAIALRVINDLPNLVRARLGAHHTADVTDAMVDTYCYAVDCDSFDSQGMLTAARWEDFADWLHWDNDGLRRVLAWLAREAP